MILAAGVGERLRPITEWLPKPLLPVANLPVAVQGLRRLAAAGIEDVCMNACYRADDIQRELGDGRRHGVRIHWSVEDRLLGTAGGMKRVESVLRDDLTVVIAGDALLDVDLTPLIETHLEKGALATIGTLSVADPSQYGVVLTSPDGRVLQFQEKPAAGTQISNQANTGIYVFSPAVFDLIPSSGSCDFARDVFPVIIDDDLPMYASPVSGYWTDIGNPAAYLAANMDYLGGRVGIEGAGELIDGSLIGAGAHVDDARLVDCVVGAGAVLSARTSLTDCVVWPDTTLDEVIEVSECVITPWGRLGVRPRA